MLEELDQPFEFRFIDVWKGQQYTPEFRALNPNGKTPIIVDDQTDGTEPIVIFESGAILMYLAEHSADSCLSPQPRSMR